ncbi:hypothetical protein I7I48_09954 [Histoplasma ohiense]|nr:hypothetical protein I7I48_09954 [Histoplasma ohiense (nom. inval.)]
MVIPGWVPRKEPTMYACVWMEGEYVARKAIPSRYSNFRCIPSIELRDNRHDPCWREIVFVQRPPRLLAALPLPSFGVRVNYEMKQ